MTRKINSILRKIAKKDKYQVMYSQAKELPIKIFRNDTDFTNIQVTFLNYLSFYHNLYIDVNMGDVESIVLTDTIYEDAYTYYKRKNRGKKYDMNIQKDQEEKDHKKTTQWIFKSKDNKKVNK